MFEINTRFRLFAAALAGGAALAGCGGNDNSLPQPATVAQAIVLSGITTVTTNSTTDAIAPSWNPTFAGRSFGAVGAYRKIIGPANGTIAPTDPQNSGTPDIALAPRNGQGLVEDSMDHYILTPVDATKSNKKVFLEAVSPQSCKPHIVMPDSDPAPVFETNY